MMETHSWLGFEGEEHEGGTPAEYAAFEEQLLSPDNEREHANNVKVICEEHGFPLSNWTPTIPSRAR